MGFNSAFKGLKLLKNPGNGRLNNLNDPVLNVLTAIGLSPGGSTHLHTNYTQNNTNNN